MSQKSAANCVTCYLPYASMLQLRLLTIPLSHSMTKNRSLCIFLAGQYASIPANERRSHRTRRFLATSLRTYLNGSLSPHIQYRGGIKSEKRSDRLCRQIMQRICSFQVCKVIPGLSSLGLSSLYCIPYTLSSPIFSNFFS